MVSYHFDFSRDGVQREPADGEHALDPAFLVLLAGGVSALNEDWMFSRIFAAMASHASSELGPLQSNASNALISTVIVSDLRCVHQEPVL